MRRTLAQLLALLLLAPAVAPAQDDGPVTLGATEVVLDVVVKGSKGRPVTDLRAEDFEVFEDGERQEISSFRLVTAGGTEPAPGAPAAAPARRPDGPSLGSAADVDAVAIVFDRLSLASRARARDAALTFLESELPKNVIIGVFSADLSLQVLQPFTSDLRLVRRAVERVTSTEAAGRDGAGIASSGPELPSSEPASPTPTSTPTGPGAATEGAAVAAAAGSEALAGVEALAAEMTQRSIETFTHLQREQQGYAATNGLMSVIASLRRIPGRKSLVLFSEGVPLPSNVMPHFQAVVGNANRANVSIYAIDAAGLRIENARTEAMRELKSITDRRTRELETGRDSTTGPLMRNAERGEDLLRLDPRTGLGMLASGTGGFVVSDTNDLAPRLRQISEDLSTYYVLTYTPKNETLDGSFRKVSVKVKRSKVEVQSREGYFAVAPSDTSPILPFEAPALAALAAGRATDTIPLRLASYSFPEPGREGLSAVLVEAPASAFDFGVDRDTKAYAADFSFVVLIKSATGEVVQRLSQNYKLVGPESSLEGVRRGEVLFYREAPLAPGRYAVEAVAYDGRTRKAAVRRGMLKVPPAGALRMSDVVIIERAERIAEGERNASNPLQVGDTLVYPDLGATIRGGAGAKLPFYVTVYRAPNGPRPSKLSIEVLRSGAPVGRVTMDLPDPDASGRVRVVNAVPIERLAPGAYLLRVTVEDGRSTASRGVNFTVAG